MKLAKQRQYLVWQTETVLSLTNWGCKMQNWPQPLETGPVLLFPCC